MTTNFENAKVKKNRTYTIVFTVTASQSSRTPPRRRGRGDGSPSDSHRPLPRCATGGWANAARNGAATHDTCSGTRNQDNPSGKP